MVVFITRRDAACFWLRLQPYYRSVSLGTVHSVPLSACINQTDVGLEEIRGCEASTDWVWWLLRRQLCERVEGEFVTIIKRCILFIKFVTVPDTNKLIVNITL